MAAKTKAKAPAPDWIVTLDGCRVGRMPTYPQAKQLADDFSKKYPPDFIFKIEQAKPAAIPHA